MLTFLSFSYRTSHEQQLLGSKPIARYLYKYGTSLIDACADTRLAGVLGSTKLDFLPTGCPQTQFATSERTIAEMKAIRSLAANSPAEADWVVVIRPAQGYVSKAKLAAFCNAIRNIKPKRTDRGIRAVSIREHCSLTHPYWNTKAAPRRLLCDSAVRVPIEEPTMRDSLEQACPDLWEMIGGASVQRSQDIPSLLHEDSALYAFRPGEHDIENLADIGTIPIRHEQCEDRDTPLFFKLPTFTMSDHHAIDVAGLERLVLKERADRELPDANRKTRPGQLVAHP